MHGCKLKSHFSHCYRSSTGNNHHATQGKDEWPGRKTKLILRSRMISPGRLDIEPMWFINAAGDWPRRKVCNNSGYKLGTFLYRIFSLILRPWNLSNGWIYPEKCLKLPHVLKLHSDDPRAFFALIRRFAARDHQLTGAEDEHYYLGQLDPVN